MFLSDKLLSSSNHFTLIRLLLSILVIYSHCYPLGNFGSEYFFGIGNDKYGNLAVNCFFVVSGFLITGSFKRSKSLKVFFLNRFLRIFPGFWVALILTAFVIGPIIYFIKNDDLPGYFKVHENTPHGYVLYNFCLKINQNSIGKLFSENNYPFLVNGAIWTLTYEFICYLLVMVAGYLGFIKKNILWILFLLILSVLNVLVYSDILKIVPSQILAFIHFLTYFVAGAFAFIYSDLIRLNKILTYSLTLVVFILALIPNFVLFNLYHLLMPLLLAHVIFGWAYFSTESNFEKKLPDLSYGLYIYGWVIQQSLVYLKIWDSNLTVYFFGVLFLTLILSVFSFYLVEKPCMNLKRLYQNK